MTPTGGGLGRFPPGDKERADRDARRKQIREARRQKERVTWNGKRFWLIRLPDAYGLNYDDFENRQGMSDL